MVRIRDLLTKPAGKGAEGNLTEPTGIGFSLASVGPFSRAAREAVSAASSTYARGRKHSPARYSPSKDTGFFHQHTGCSLFRCQWCERTSQGASTRIPSWAHSAPDWSWLRGAFIGRAMVHYRACTFGNGKGRPSSMASLTSIR